MKVKSILGISLLGLLTACGTFSKTQTLNPETNYFAAKDKEVTILKEIWINPDTLKTLLVTPDSDYFLTMGKNLDFFEEVITFSELEKRIQRARIGKKIPVLTDRPGLQEGAEIYKPYVLMEFFKRDMDNGLFAGFVLYDAKRDLIIFENEIKVNLMWDGWTDQGTMFPLYNSLLEYLRKQ